MKTFIHTFFILTLLFFTSCDKNTPDNDLTFEAIVMGINYDCHLPIIEFTTNVEKVNQIAELQPSKYLCYRFIAKNLPINLQEEGTIIELKIRKIQAHELGVCTAMGPSYPWIYILEAKEKK